MSSAPDGKVTMNAISNTSDHAGIESPPQKTNATIECVVSQTLQTNMQGTFSYLISVNVTISDLQSRGHVSDLQLFRVQHRLRCIA